MDGLDRVRVGDEQPRRPEPIGQVVAVRLELGRQPAVEDDEPGPGVVIPAPSPGPPQDQAWSSMMLPSGSVA